ncbi:DUF4222 domain-containing protein [Arsenophonus nasoniae]|uniref:DUF4222 domain-containing protein n=1 Tax=Arsenophonus nasoniae TaxID=638 RepID=A0AA95K8U7_9GAMM|nr:DUF4222 domain-containing protein [Arsenophonus nasoniae]WGL96272.1 DUF4222 domain-containing protein [Arsenophonus nasoniae]
MTSLTKNHGISQLRCRPISGKNWFYCYEIKLVDMDRWIPVSQRFAKWAIEHVNDLYQKQKLFGQYFRDKRGRIVRFTGYDSKKGWILFTYEDGSQCFSPVRKFHQDYKRIEAKP